MSAPPGTPWRARADAERECCVCVRVDLGIAVSPASTKIRRPVLLSDWIAMDPDDVGADAYASARVAAVRLVGDAPMRVFMVHTPVRSLHRNSWWRS